MRETKTTQAGTGTSEHKNSRMAGIEAARKAVSGLNGLQPHLILVFATVAHNQGELIKGITEITGDTPLSGSVNGAAIGSPPVPKSAMFLTRSQAVASGVGS